VVIRISTGPWTFVPLGEETARRAARRRRCETAEWSSDRRRKGSLGLRQTRPITVPTEQTVVVSTQHNRQVLEGFDALLGADDLDELDELCTPDMVNHALAPDRPAGLAGTREFLETQGRHQMTGQYWDKLVVVAEGEYIVQFGRRGGDWAGGDFMGISAEAGSYVRDFAAMYRFQDGKIAERWAIRDDLGMLKQLGAFDPPTG
jgi:predicted ester cyclase